MSTKSLAHYMTLNYPYELSRDNEEEGYFATHIDLPGCMAEGATADEAIENLDEARELWIATRLDGGYPVPEPVGAEYSGRCSLRMTPSLHSRLVKLSRRENMSLNSLLNSALSLFAGASEVTLELSDDIRAIKGAIMQLTAAQSLTFGKPARFEVNTGTHGFRPQDSTATTT